MDAKGTVAVLTAEAWKHPQLLPSSCTHQSDVGAWEKSPEAKSIAPWQYAMSPSQNNVALRDAKWPLSIQAGDALNG